MSRQLLAAAALLIQSQCLGAAEGPQPLSPAAASEALASTPVAGATVLPTPVPTEDPAFESEAYSVRGTRLGGTATKMDIPIRDVPGTVAVISNETLKQQNANDWVGAMRNIPGALAYRTYGGFTQATMRGLARNDLLYLFDGVRDAATVSAGSSSPQANNSMENIDRVEVLKGPQALLYGQGAVAGVINSIRKKPSSSTSFDLSATWGEWDKKRVSLGAQGGLLGPLNYRLDLGWDDNYGFRSSRETRGLVSLALGSKLWDGAEVNLYSMFERDRYSLDVGIPIDPATGRIRPGVPLNRRYNTHNDFETRDNGQCLLEFMQDIGEDWQVANRTSYMPNEDVYLAAETLTILTYTASTVSRGYLYFNTRRWPLMNNLELSGKFDGRYGEHKLLLGHEYQHYEQHGLGFQTGFGAGLVNPPPVDLYDPVDTAPSIGGIHPNRRTVVKNYGQAVYFQDYWTMHKGVKFLVGARYDDWQRSQFMQKLDQTNKTENVVDAYSTSIAATAAPVYKAGLVFGPFADFNFYLAQGNSYFPNFKTDDAKGRVSFDPETGEMLEGGVKYEAMGGKLMAGAAVYDIYKYKILNNPPAVGGVKDYQQAGTLRSTGAEFEFNLKPSGYYSLQLGYAYTDASFLSFLTDPNAPFDKTKNFSGNRPSFVPMHSANLWGTAYLANGLGLGFGGRYVADSYTSETNQVVMPAHSVLNAALYYRMGWGDWQLNVDNILDLRDYFVSSIRTFQLYPGEPRMVSTRFSMKY